MWVAPLSSKLDKQVEMLGNSNKKYKDLDRSVLLAMLCAEKTVNHAGWSEIDKVGVNIGSSRGATATFEKFFLHFYDGKKLPPSTSPATTLGNIAFWSGDYIGSRGAIISHSITCSTALHSLLNGIAWLQSGLSEKFIVGGSEAPLTPFTLAQMKALKVYTEILQDAYPCRALDFKKARNTMVLGEGACCLAIERGNPKNALAYIKGIGFATENLIHGASISANGDCMQKAMHMAIGSMPKEHIDILVTHTPATVKGDISEYDAIKKVFGDNMPAITTNKWKLGHTFAPSGAFSIEMAVMMLQNRSFVSTPYFSQSKPDRFRNILVNAVGFGGNATVNFDEEIVVQGARVHNLKNIDINIPRYKLVVITGLSGSGKSSLAFDTIYAEGQRRYMETFSAYARQFIGHIERPDVDKIDGLSPVISIEQKTTSKSPRSTVGTITEIYDFLRLLFAKTSDAYSYLSGKKMVKYSNSEILDIIFKDFENKNISILAPVVRDRKGHYRELFKQISKRGFLKIRVDGVVKDITPEMKLDRYKIHNIEIVIDRLTVRSKKSGKNRLFESVKTALHHGEGVLLVLEESGAPTPRYFSSTLMCPDTGISYPKPDPNLFSFNSTKGMCPKCLGLGLISEVSIDKIVPDENISIMSGGLDPMKNSNSNWVESQLDAISKKYKFSLKDPIKNIPKKALNMILYGGREKVSVNYDFAGVVNEYKINFRGVVNTIKDSLSENSGEKLRKWAECYMDTVPCPDCKGTRLKKESIHFKLDKLNIAQVVAMDIKDLKAWLDQLEKKLTEKQWIIAEEIIKEIKGRVSFLLDVGLDYLTLSRSSASLSGGEAQRIRLATQIGSQLVNVLYILDEPSIGLHQRDNERLINSLKSLRDLGNSVIVVEHDKDMIVNADYVVDMGPKAGINGGEIIFQGAPKVMQKSNIETAQYILGLRKTQIPKIRREGNGNYLTLKGCTGNNLRNITLKLPLGKMVGITGVSGSGKSTLINETLYPIVSKHIYKSSKVPLPYKSIDGLEHIDKIIDIDQNSIGRTPRSNPATYTGVFAYIRSLFSQTPESQIRGYKPGRFSFNVAGGRCEECKGGGLKMIEMNLLPDVYVECKACNGKRFNRETLEVRYKGKSIHDVLSMTINQAMVFFENIPHIYNKIKTIVDVGLGYITLGQSSTTISGGEAQRMKLAAELSKKATGNTLYILDEPTTGLHFFDVDVLLKVLQKLTDKGNTVVIIEHNLDVIKAMDYLIDLGLEGGKKGGEIIAEGTPEELITSKKSITARYLKKELLSHGSVKS
ncbi:UvrABC system protein A [Elysia marginata]|uniref:UvrABC system protein A n=1 Tax=Elysia marginata TaxID=1093978 RepID=A0AAV4FQU0_9GAST|nr:UvrABC system protein A [Elysia marginata]